jgi:hypothetical protein
MLGCGVFFAPFIRNYSDLVSYIPDMIKTTFSWDETTWKRDYRKLWEDFNRGYSSHANSSTQITVWNGSFARTLATSVLAAC